MLIGIMLFLFMILAYSIVVPFFGLLIDMVTEYYKEVFTNSLLD